MSTHGFHGLDPFVGFAAVRVARAENAVVSDRCLAAVLARLASGNRPKTVGPLPERPVAWAPASSRARRISSTAGHSARGHPIGPLRDVLASQGLPDARAVEGMDPDAEVHFAGLVINRQQPGTANGVVFMTLEDETGFVNLVLWPDVFARYHLLARTELFLGASGRLQKQDGVTHMIVDHLWTPRLERRPAANRSRDFH